MAMPSGMPLARKPWSWVEQWLAANNLTGWAQLMHGSGPKVQVMLDGVNVRTDCSTLYEMQASECTFHLSASWPSPGLQAGPAFLYYDQLASGSSTAQRVNVTCPPADWPAALAAAGATLAPCGTATACSGQELVDALTALQPVHARLLVTLACNMTAPPMPRDAATGAPLPLQLYRNVTIAGRRDAPTELSMRHQLDYFELVGLEPFMVMADVWIPYAPMGPPSTWPRGLAVVTNYSIKRPARDNLTDFSSGGRMRVALVRAKPVHLPEVAQYNRYWFGRLNAASDSERASAAWMTQMHVLDPAVKVMDEDGMPSVMVRGWDLTYFGAEVVAASLVQPPLPNPVALWALEDPPVGLSHLDWVLGNHTEDAGRQLLRLLVQQQPVTGSDPRVILLTSNVTLSSAWWPQGGVLLNRSVTITGPAAEAPVWLDMGGVLLLQANSSAKLSLRNLLVANMRAVPPNNSTAAGLEPDALARWLQRCGSPGLDAASLGSHQLHNCTLLLGTGLIDQLVDEVAEVQAAAAVGRTSPAGNSQRSSLLGTMVSSWAQVSSPGPGAVAVQQGWLLGLRLNTTTLRAHNARIPEPLGDAMDYAACSVAAAYASDGPPASGGMEESSGGGGSSCCSSAQAGAIAGGIIGGVLVLAAAFGLLYAAMQRQHTHCCVGLWCVGKAGQARAANVGVGDGGDGDGGCVCDLEVCDAVAGTYAAPAHDAALAGTSAAKLPPPPNQQQQEQQPGAPANNSSSASAGFGLVVQADHKGHPTHSSDQAGPATSSSRWTQPSQGLGVDTLSGSAGAGQTMIDQVHGGAGPPAPSPMALAANCAAAPGQPPGAQMPAKLGQEDLLRLLMAAGSSGGCSGSSGGALTSGDELVLEGILGVGGGGIVHKGIWRGLVVAVKQMALPLGSSPLQEERRLREVALSDSLHHPNIVTTFHYDLLPLCMTPALAQQQQPHDAAAVACGRGASAARAPGTGVGASAGGPAHVIAYKLLLVQQLCEGGSLRQALNQGYFKQPDGSLHMVRAVLAALDIIQGLQHLHTCNVIHGDMTAGNVLLKAAAAHNVCGRPRSDAALAPTGAPAEAGAREAEEPGVAPATALAGVVQHALPHVFKIADFGLSVLLSPDKSHASGLHQGTVYYVAPEVAYRGHLSPAADVYGFGVLLWEMANARSVGSLRLPTFPSALGSALLGACAPGLPDALRQLIGACLRPEPKERPSAEEASKQLRSILEDMLGSSTAAAALRACTRAEVEMRMTLGQVQQQQEAQEVQQQ